MFPLKTGPTQARWQAAMRDKAFDLIGSRKLMETASEHFLAVLNAGTISTNMFLRRLHNFAVGMHWLPWPVLPKPRPILDQFQNIRSGGKLDAVGRRVAERLEQPRRDENWHKSVFIQTIS
jgi:hypothetical protein